MSAIDPSVTHSTPNKVPTLTPYLQLRHLLSLSWLAYPITSFLFVAIQLQVTIAASREAVANAKSSLLTSCKAAEQASGSAASMPRIMAIAANQQFIDAVNGSLQGARGALTLSLTVMEAVINFIIDMYRGTLLCFLELAVRGSLGLLIDISQNVNDLMKTASGNIQTSVQSSVQSANDAINKFVSGVNKLPGANFSPPQIAVPDLNSLANIQFPSSFQDSLTKLNSSLPSVEDMKAKLESFIDTPFELLKQEINDTFSKIAFNSSMMPVPDRNSLSFCDDIDISAIDDLGRDLDKTAKIGTLIVIGAAVVLTGLNCLWIWYKWRSLKKHLERIRQGWSSDPTMYHQTSGGVPQVTLTDHNLLVLQSCMSHPLLTRISNLLSRLLRLTPQQYTNLQWFFNYIFHPPAVAVLLVGIFGLLCVEVQLAAMGPMAAKYEDRAASSVSDFSRIIASAINDSMYNQSAAYANAVNSHVDSAQNTLNDGVFGWVNVTTTTVNNTVNEFYTDIENFINGVFGGTVLEKPAQDVVRCLIGTKVEAIENALTFLHDNLKVDMPRVNDSVLVVSPETVNETVTPIAAAAIGGGQGDNKGLVGRLVDSYASSLRTQRYTFLILIGLWVLVVLMGIAFLLWRTRGQKGMKSGEGAGPGVIAFPPHTNDGISYEKHWDNSLGDTKLEPWAKGKETLSNESLRPPIPKMSNWFRRNKQKVSTVDNDIYGIELPGAPREKDVPKSRWSHSPNTLKAPWAGVLSPRSSKPSIPTPPRTINQRHRSPPPPPVHRGRAGKGAGQNPFIMPGELNPFEPGAI